MRNLDDVVAFVAEDGRAIYGRVVARQDLVLTVLDTDGCLHRVLEGHTRGVREDYEGDVLLTSSEVAYLVRQQTQEMLNDPMLPALIQAVNSQRRHGIRARLDSVPESAPYESFDAIPIRMFTGRQLDASGRPAMTRAMERYLFDSDERRNRFNGLLRRLKERAPRQHLVYTCVHFGGMRQVDIVNLHGLKKGHVSRDLKLAEAWIDARMGTNVAGVER